MSAITTAESTASLQITLNIAVLVCVCFNLYVKLTSRNVVSMTSDSSLYLVTSGIAVSHQLLHAIAPLRAVYQKVADSYLRHRFYS